ncbi:LacI family transcriptional regulator [Rugosimonospora africana]|uniref:LacI family transcriptional regulator n=1 Tax=Rugosimonospora africana TaxID=556532 RepID=A0A8J3R3E8_9ACTN|nr:LacI family transcriptional regulator [Rugosimonospora africana]
MLASIRTLNYHPHAGARALASNRANVIALVLPLRAGMHVPVLMQFAVSVVTTAREFDQDVLLMTADEGADGLRRMDASALVDGLILMDVELDDARIPLLCELDRPSVLIGFPAQPAGLTCVDLDFYRAGQVCVEHLARLGHTDVALIGAPGAVYDRGTGFARRTMAGFLDMAAALRMSAAAGPCEQDPVAVGARVDELLARHPALTGLVVHNEAVVDPLLAALVAHGRRVPEQVSVVAICPDGLAHRATPALTSVLIPAEEVGTQAVRLLMRKLGGQPVPDSSLLPPRLTVRDSTAPPPRV